MKHKILTYALVSALGLGLAGAGLVSAHGLFGGFGNLSSEEIVSRQQAAFQNQAQMLGISVDEVKDAWVEGKSIKQIAEEKGISQEQIQSRMKDMQAQNMKSQLQALVEKGVITQDQADKRFQTMQNRLQNSKGWTGKRFHGGFYF
jgi:uncharacterized protein YaiL (DUF2058 family)